MNSSTITIKDLARKYLGDDVDSEDLKYVFYNNSCDLHVCVMETNRYPKLNDFLEEYFKTYKYINVADYQGWTALHYASCYSRTRSTERTVEILINAGAEINFKTYFGRTALLLAICNYNTSSTKETVKLLIQADADVFNSLDSYNNQLIYYFSDELLEHCQIDKNTQTIGIKTGRFTKAAKK